MKKIQLAILALTALPFMTFAQSFSIGISGPGYSFHGNNGYYVPPAYNRYGQGYYNAPRYVAPPPAYYPNYGYQRPYVYQQRERHYYQPLCTTYYTQYGPRTECF